MWGYILIILGLISFFIGDFFLGKVQGQNDCKEKPETTENNYKGGIAGVVLGIIFILIGCIVRSMPARQPEYSDGSN